MRGGSVINVELLEAGGRGVRFLLSQPIISQGPGWGFSWAGIPAHHCPVSLSSPRRKQRLSCCLRGRVTGGSGRGHSASMRAPLVPSPSPPGPSSRWTPQPGLPGPEPSLSISAHGGPPQPFRDCLRLVLLAEVLAVGPESSSPEPPLGGLWGDNHAHGGARRLSSSLVLC